MLLSCLQGQFLSALDSLLQFAEDLLVDIPKFWDFLAQVGFILCKLLLVLLIKGFRVQPKMFIHAFIPRLWRPPLHPLVLCRWLLSKNLQFR